MITKYVPVLLCTRLSRLTALSIPGNNAEATDAEFVDRYDYLGYGSGVDECYDSEDYYIYTYVFVLREQCSEELMYSER